MSEERGDYDTRGLIDNTKYLLRDAAKDILNRRDPKSVAHIKAGTIYRLRGEFARSDRGFFVTGIGTNPLSLLPVIHGVMLTVVGDAVEEAPMMLEPRQIGEHWSR